MNERVVIDVAEVYGDIAKIDRLDEYTRDVLRRAGSGNEVVLTGPGPVWLYLWIAHALHGKAKRLIYSSPALEQDDLKGEITIFDHDPF